jgi:hypothetical protein
MRKVLTFLVAIFVCALQTTAGAYAQNVTQTDSSVQNPASAAEEAPSVSFSALEISDKIAQAKELLKSRPALPNLDSIRLAAFDPQSSQIDFLSLNKDSFLAKGNDFAAVTASGRTVQVRVIRANGVNTAVSIFDSAHKQTFLPLAVQYPIVRNGALQETALYTSAHPALMSREVVEMGKTYVTNMLGQAVAQLAAAGVTIEPEIVHIAEHLVVVEHTDHQRFLHEDRTKLFPEILSLYAFNQDDTFNFSVSTAGAGGMIQMIPRTYEAVRQQHQGATLEPDFVHGMRDHANALKAMLLYLNDTWSKLQESAEVQDALRSGLATKAELLAAGYNSNPLRLPGYLKNGGAAWRSLIPSETQMYLAIYSAVDSNIDFGANASASNTQVPATTVNPAEPGLISTLLSLVSNGLLLK